LGISTSEKDPVIREYIVEMSKLALYIKLYIVGIYKTWTSGIRFEPEGIHGSLVLNDFVDVRQDPDKRHSVVAFVLPPGSRTEDYIGDLWGPFGYSSEVAEGNFRLYARDSWGTVQDYQLKDNPKLKKLSDDFPNWTIVLAGVRSVYGFHLPPLNDPSNFVLVSREAVTQWQ